MYDTLLIPVDLSHAEAAPKMFAAAKALAEPDARLIAVNVAPDIPVYAASYIPDAVLSDATSGAEDALREIVAEHAPGAEVDARMGAPGSAIVAAATEHGAEVIVIASHKPGLADYLLGSTAAWVARHSPCSVHVIR